MKYGLNIPPNGALDFLSLGALVHRLDPGIIPFRKATECQIHVSGGEFNCAANLSDCFRLKTGIATAMVDYPIGDLIAERVRAMGVQAVLQAVQAQRRQRPQYGHRLQRPRLWRTRPGRLLQPLQRSRRAAQAGRLRLERHLLRAVCAGSTAAASLRRSPKPPAKLIIEGMKAAKAAGAVTSFDLNYRAKLWNIWGGQERAQSVIRRIVENVDVLVGNEEDLQLGLGIPGPEVRLPSPSSTRALSSA